MQLAIEILVYGGLIPAAVSMAVMLICGRLLPANGSNRYAAAAGFTVAFFVGYVLLPPWAPLQPTRSWHWLPYLAIIAMFLGPLALAEGVYRGERWALHLLIALVSALLLVPQWPDLAPLRPLYILLLTGYFFFVSALVDLLPDRMHGPQMLVHLSIVAVWTSIMLAVFVSVIMGQVAWVAASGLLGCCVVAGFVRPSETVSRGLIPLFAVVVGGLAFIGNVTPQPPLWGILLVPAAPLLLWCCAAGPLARLRPMARQTGHLVALLVPLGIAWLVAVFEERVRSTW